MVDRALTIRDLCERYGVGEHTVLAWIKSGELRAINCGRRSGGKKPRWRITSEALATFELIRTYNLPPPHTKRQKQSNEIIQFY